MVVMTDVMVVLGVVLSLPGDVKSVLSSNLWAIRSHSRQQR